jgi:hypothetical protein
MAQHAQEPKQPEANVSIPAASSPPGEPPVREAAPAPAKSPSSGPRCPDCGGSLVPYTGTGNPHKVGTGFCTACGGRKPLNG